MKVFIEALDELGLALAEHSHRWTARQRRLYERAISLCRTDFGSSASTKFQDRSPSLGQRQAFFQGEGPTPV